MSTQGNFLDTVEETKLVEVQNTERSADEFENAERKAEEVESSDENENSEGSADENENKEKRAEQAENSERSPKEFEETTKLSTFSMHKKRFIEGSPETIGNNFSIIYCEQTTLYNRD